MSGIINIVSRPASFLSIAGAVLAGFMLLIGCNRTFDNPHDPAGPNYEGVEWTQDGDGNGVADSVEKYAPGCPLAPSQCLTAAKEEKARVLAQKADTTIRIPSDKLQVRDMLIWVGDPGMQPYFSGDSAGLAGSSYTLQSADTSVAAAVGGMVHPVAAGNTRIDFTTGTGIKGFFNVTVVAQGTRVQSLSAENLFLIVGGSPKPPVITWNPSTATYRNFRMVSAHPSIASASQNLVYPQSPGVAQLTVESEDGSHKANFTVQVVRPEDYRPVQSVTVAPLFLGLGSGDTLPHIQWTPIDASNKGYRLVSQHTHIVSVVEGKLRPISLGTAAVLLIAADEGGKYAPFEVTVTSSLAPVVSLSAPNIQLRLGDGDRIPEIAWQPVDAHNKNFSLSSSDSAVVSIAGGIAMRPLSLGKAWVTVTAEDGGKQTVFSAEVLPLDSGVALTGVTVSDMEIRLGDAAVGLQVEWIPVNAGNRNFILSSLNTSVVKIETGKVAPVAVGQAKVVLTTEEGGLKDTALVTVKPKFVALTAVEVAKMNFILGESPKAPTITWIPENASEKTYNLVHSSNTSVATISSDKQRVVAQGKGLATLVLQSGSVSKSFEVVVEQVIPVISVSGAPFHMNIGDPDFDLGRQLSWNPTNATDKRFTAKSSNTARAQIIGTTHVRALDDGLVTIEVTTLDGGKKASFQLEVIRPVVSVKVSDMKIGMLNSPRAPSIDWTPTDATYKKYTLVSGNTGVVRITEDGQRVEGAGVGTTTVTLMVQDSKVTATFTVDVTRFYASD